jgi:hypothetical protein
MNAHRPVDYEKAMGVDPHPTQARDLYWSLVVAVIVNSAIYLVAVMYAGLIVGNPFAWRCSIAAMGMTYLSYYVQLMKMPTPLIYAFVAASIVLGFAAGVSLLVI